MGEGPLILAMDIATVTGWAYGRVGERPRSGAVRFGSGAQSYGKRMAMGMNWLHDFLTVNEVKYFVYEAPLATSLVSGKTNASTTMILFGLVGVVEAVANSHKIYSVKSAHLSTVRKHFIGTGNLPGALAKMKVRARCRTLGWEFDDHNAADALAVWDYAGNLLAPNYAANTVFPANFISKKRK